MFRGTNSPNLTQKRTWTCDPLQLALASLFVGFVVTLWHEIVSGENWLRQCLVASTESELLRNCPEPLESLELSSTVGMSQHQVQFSLLYRECIYEAAVAYGHAFGWDNFIQLAGRWFDFRKGRACRGKGFQIIWAKRLALCRIGYCKTQWSVPCLRAPPFWTCEDHAEAQLLKHSPQPFLHAVLALGVSAFERCAVAVFPPVCWCRSNRLRQNMNKMDDTSWIIRWCLRHSKYITVFELWKDGDWTVKIFIVWIYTAVWYCPLVVGSSTFGNIWMFLGESFKWITPAVRNLLVASMSPCYYDDQFHPLKSQCQSPLCIRTETLRNTDAVMCFKGFLNIFVWLIFYWEIQFNPFPSRFPNHSGLAHPRARGFGRCAEWVPRRVAWVWLDEKRLTQNKGEKRCVRMSKNTEEFG